MQTEAYGTAERAILARCQATFGEGFRGPAGPYRDGVSTARPQVVKALAATPYTPSGVDAQSDRVVKRAKAEMMAELQSDIDFLAELSVNFAPLKPLLFAAWHEKWSALWEEVRGRSLFRSARSE